ncbi:MAG: cobalamin biosynthesis protein CbiX [Rhodobacteraceae bacterium]|nr:cobalamin biosynthesis protein CbiX [Paracoccaceae bacterium]
MPRHAVIVAHGQPSDPAPAEATLGELAAAVRNQLPGWTVAGATLAQPGRLAEAIGDRKDALIFPFFMSDGWFINHVLPRDAEKSGVAPQQILRPFGCMAASHALAADIAADAAKAFGHPVRDTTLILAAHGSGRSRNPAQVAAETAAAIGSRMAFRDIRLGFIEEAPYLDAAAQDTDARSLCLPLFVGRWGHVEKDIPAALERAGFAGHCLDPIGCHASVPAIVAEALASANANG